jgi:LacI family transcriptional regulator
VNHTSQAEYYLRRSLLRGHVDGVMFFSMKFPESIVAKFQQINLPLVLVDAYHPLFDSIRVENREGAMNATRHLLGLGHRNIAMINASLETQPAQDRLEGFRAALEEAGIPFSMDRVVISTIGKQDGYNRDAGRASMIELLQRMPGPLRPTALFIASDVQAIGALEALRDAGIRVPEDMAIVSFDDIELAQHAQLTTMRQPMYDMGVLALEKLLSRMQNPSQEPTLTAFMPELVIRTSCGTRMRNRTIGSAPTPAETRIGL